MTTISTMPTARMTCVTTVATDRSNHCRGCFTRPQLIDLSRDLPTVVIECETSDKFLESVVKHCQLTQQDVGSLASSEINTLLNRVRKRRFLKAHGEHDMTGMWSELHSSQRRLSIYLMATSRVQSSSAPKTKAFVKAP